MEFLHSLQILPQAWIVVRVDGSGFSKLTNENFEKPFDEKFHDLMMGTAQTLLAKLQGIYCYSFSDEISVVLPPTWDLFERRWEKTLSVSAGIASSHFTHLYGKPVHFHSHIWVGAREPLLMDYLCWKQANALRHAIYEWCYWTLRKEGYGRGEATKELKGKSWEGKVEFLLRKGINFKEIPLWQRRGAGIYWKKYQKQGFNPKREETVLVMRRRVEVVERLPEKEQYRKWLQGILEGDSS